MLKKPEQTGAIIQSKAESLGDKGNADLFTFPAAQGCAAISSVCKTLKMKESGNHVFAFRADY